MIGGKQGLPPVLCVCSVSFCSLCSVFYSECKLRTIGRINFWNRLCGSSILRIGPSLACKTSSAIMMNNVQRMFCSKSIGRAAETAEPSIEGCQRTDVLGYFCSILVVIIEILIIYRVSQTQQTCNRTCRSLRGQVNHESLFEGMF